jgi:cell division protease FtsH
LKKHKDGLHQLAAILLEKEVIFTEDLEKIFGKRPWKTQHERETEAKKELDEKIKSISKDIKKEDTEVVKENVVEENPEVKKE